MAGRVSSASSGIITLLTDFGTCNAFVGIMKGVILGAYPRARLVDLTHDLDSQDVLGGALLLRSAVPYFPCGTVHLAVVDPGVGSSRRGLVIATRTALLVGPDNGILSLAARALGGGRAQALDIDQLVARRIVRAPVSQTFHGRDVFAPIAAHLAKGRPLRSLGPAVDRIVELALPACRITRTQIVGEVIYIDRFGNLITNIGAEDLNELASYSPASLSVSIGRVRSDDIDGLVPAYASVPQGTPLAILGSWGQLEIAVRDGNARQRLSARCGTPVRVTVNGNALKR
ncbi:MAG: SAM-dependent chlorinase/fluorinase [Deltaproteobacteria bacterium]|nr:SAM-dependent chlorinase/fluorinase [Deltaproteobacteria bacterium]MBI3387520.1 SAM-dependent chlorinase/fluorinase [Deltaproteobacteria bacterium]